MENKAKFYQLNPYKLMLQLYLQVQIRLLESCKVREDTRKRSVSF